MWKKDKATSLWGKAGIRIKGGKFGISDEAVDIQVLEADAEKSGMLANSLLHFASSLTCNLYHARNTRSVDLRRLIRLIPIQRNKLQTPAAGCPGPAGSIKPRTLV